MQKIEQIIKKFNLSSRDIIPYGNYIAKLDLANFKKNKNSKLILVTAVSPTSSGEGKTTVSINLTDALNRLGKKAIVALREPSIGPCFGVKGGATGAGKASIVPSNEINLHFTGDIHAITTANNLIAACIDNEIYHGNKLNINPERIIHTRVMDMNDRSLRNIIVKINDAVSYKTRFDITSACELMTIFCLSTSIKDFKNKLNDMVVAYSKSNKPILVKHLKITNAVLDLVKDCFKPNAVQTLEGNLALVSGGPFANISVGISSYIATAAGLKLADYLVTEAGFGSDLGAEKFMNVLCQQTGLRPNCIVLVSTIQSILEQGEGSFKKGIKNLDTHINHIRQYGVPFVVAINSFKKDQKTHEEQLTKYLNKKHVNWTFNYGFANGSKGGIELANEVIRLSQIKSKVKFLYNNKQSLRQKIETIVSKCYGIKIIKYSPKAIALLERYSKNNYYVCMSKKPGQIATNHLNNQEAIFVEDILFNSGSKLAVVLCDKIFRMPGLSKNPRAKNWK